MLRTGGWGLPSARAQAEGSGLTLHFDRLSVLSLPKEAALLYPAFKRAGLAPPNGSKGYG